MTERNAAKSSLSICDPAKLSDAELLWTAREWADKHGCGLTHNLLKELAGRLSSRSGTVSSRDAVLAAALRRIIDCRVNDARGIFTAEFINARIDAEAALKNAK